MRPLVSILIPAYNSERWIEQTIKSALDQSWRHKEIIVVDDGSGDATSEIARRFAASNCLLIRQQNRGAAAARNTALEAAQGEYIQWLDADDLLDRDKISSQLAAVTGPGDARTLLSGSFGKFIHRPQRATFSETSLWHDLSAAEFLLRKFEGRVHMQTATWLVSRVVTDAAGPWDARLSYDDDGEYFARVLMASTGTRFVRDSRVYYRSVGVGSVSYIGDSDRKLDSMWRSMQLQIGYLRLLQDDDRTRRACVMYLQNYAADFYPRRGEIFAEMREMARNLGGHLHQPNLPWKYRWIEATCGWRAAQAVRATWQSAKWSALRRWDLLMLRRDQAADARGRR